MDFDYNRVYAGKVYTNKKGEVKPYKSTKSVLTNIKKIVDWCQEVDFSDAGAIRARIKQYPGWPCDKTCGDKMTDLATFIRILDITGLEKLGINPLDKPNVLKAYSSNAWDLVDNAPSTVARKEKRKRPEEADIWWDPEQHTEFVQNKIDRARELIQRGLANLSDDEKDELQQCILVIWYRYLPNIRVLQHTLKKSEYNDHSNFLVRYPLGRVVIIYNSHKMASVQGAVVHNVSEVEHNEMQEFIDVLFDMYPKSTHLFNHLSKRRPFTDAEFYKYIIKAHGDEIGARLLRVMEHSEFWDGIPSYNAVMEYITARGHSSIGRSMEYGRN